MKRLALIFLFFVAIGTVIFWSDNALDLPSGVDAADQSQQMWPEKMWPKIWDRTIYSTDLLIPMLDMRGGDVRIPNAAGWFYEGYEAFHRFVGWVLIVSLIAWITAVAKGDRSDR